MITNSKISNVFKILGICSYLLYLPVSCSTSASSRQAQRLNELRNRDTALLSEDEILEIKLEDEFAKAERFVGIGQYDNALEIVQSIISDHAGTVFSDRAYYFKGFTYTNVLFFDRDLEKAAAAFRMVLASDPVTDFDPKAQQMLDRIKKR